MNNLQDSYLFYISYQAKNIKIDYHKLAKLLDSNSFAAYSL